MKAKHTFTINGKTKTRVSPRNYTHIVIGDVNPSWGRPKTDDDTDLALGWSQSEKNAASMARTLTNRGWLNVKVYPVTTREAR